MARKLPWKRSSDPRQEPAPSPRRVSPKLETPRRIAATPSSSAPVTTRHRPAALAIVDSSDPLRSPSTSPPPEPPQERYMLPGDDHYRIVEDELLHTAQRFTTHLHRAEYNRLKLIAKSKNGAAIREIERPVVGPLTSDARRRRDRAKRLSKQRSVLSAHDDGSNGSSANQDDGATGNSPWVGTNLRGLLNAPRAETRSLPPQTSVAAAAAAAAAVPPLPPPSSSRTKAAVGHRPALPASTTPRHKFARADNFETGVSTGRARHPVTPASSSNIASSSSAPRRHAKIEAEAPTPEDDLDFDDPFGINKRRLDRQKSRDQLRKTIRSTPTNTPSSSDTMPSFV